MAAPSNYKTKKKEKKTTKPLQIGIFCSDVFLSLSTTLPLQCLRSWQERSEA